MLEEIRVRDLALIEDVRLELAEGMTVLTGETGAGKTALVGAIKLLIGERADSTLVRAGSPETVVEGRVVLADTEHVVRRRVSSEGRSRCTVDGDMATVGELSERFGPLFDLHGQHEHQALLDTASHVQYLDRYAGEPAADAMGAYRAARSEYRDALAEHARTESEVRETAEKAEYLRFLIEEIDSVAPQVGEDDALRARMPGLVHGERLTAAASEAHAALSREAGASDALGLAGGALSRVADLDPVLDAFAERLARLSTEVDELAIEMRDYAENLEYDPAVLDEVQQRLATLEDAQKRYGPSLDDVIATAAQARQDLERLEHGDEELARAAAEVESARGRLEGAGECLIALRAGAAEGFVEALAAAVGELAMEHARFEVAAEELPVDEWGQDGPQRVEFLYAPGADQPARSLSRIASGGELSRVMLALKGVLGTADHVPVLVFDEVDAGIGGATATAVGASLRSLAATHQVLVVTHLAQVAAMGDRHLVVEKTSDSQGVSTSVTAVDGDERAAEIARMLSGTDSEASRVHARELLEASPAQAV